MVGLTMNVKIWIPVIWVLNHAKDCRGVKSKLHEPYGSQYFIVQLFVSSNSNSDLFRCSNVNSKMNCTENWGFQECGQLETAKFKNYACMRLTTETSNCFECANRYDKAEIMFKRPPVPTEERQQTFQPNYNLILDFDETYIYCGKRNFTYDSFMEISESHRDEQCSLKTSGNITLFGLWEDLLTDFSFKMSPILSEL